MTLLKNIFVKGKTKKALEIHKGIKGFSSIGEALEDLLKESPQYLNLLKILGGYEEETEEVIDLNKLEIEDLI